jgi:hypothetical protein
MKSKNLDILDWASIILGGATLIAGLLRIIGPSEMVARLDSTTLTYFAVAGALLMLRSIKSLSFGDYKLELKDLKEKTEEALEEAKTAASMARQSGQAANAQPSAPASTESSTSGLEAAGSKSVVDALAVWEREPGMVKDDPWKRCFGEKRENNDRRLSAEVMPVAGEEGWYRIRLWVASTSEVKPLKGKVRFFIHPSFGAAKPFVDVVGGIAELRLKAWGAFTVGALADEGETELEYDLELDTDFPRQFRSR